MSAVARKSVTLVRRPEELVYRSCYAPADLREMLKSADTRSRIRHLPPSPLYFSLKELEEEEMALLLPHLSEEQWTGILDLDLWSRDRVSDGQWLYWQKHIVEAPAPVARKLLRAADPELWELTFKRNLQIYGKDEDQVRADLNEGEWLETPDEKCLIVLPKNPDQARLLRSLILRLYELEPERVALTLQSARFRTASEIEERAYQNRKRRIEDLGFQDYFDAISIYTFLPPETPLPEKSPDRIYEVNLLPVRLPQESEGPLLIFRAFANLTRRQEIQPLVEELFYVCNKVLSADRISAADPARLKRGIRKAITGMNLGLEWWSGQDLEKAAQGVRRHYLQSFLQAGYSRLLELQNEARRIRAGAHRPAAGSFGEAFLEGLLKRYPLLTEPSGDRLRRRFLRDCADLEKGKETLREVMRGD